MVKAAPKKKPTSAQKGAKKNTGRPIRAAVQAARQAALKKLEEQEQKEASSEETEVVIDSNMPVQPASSPRHVVVETETESGDVEVDLATKDESQKESESVDVSGAEVGRKESEESASESIAMQNVAESIASEGSTEYATVRKNVSSSRLFFVALGTGVFLGVVIFGGWILYDSFGADFSLPSFTKPTPSPTKAPPPSPTPVTIKPASYSLQILNGTGVSGAASSVESALNSAGFTNATTGNASQYGFTDTEVGMKSSIPSAVFEKIKSSLSGYNVVQVTSLPSDGTYDIVVTVGTQN